MLFVMFCDILISNVYMERSAHLRPQGAMLSCVRLMSESEVEEVRNTYINKVNYQVIHFTFC